MNLTRADLQKISNDPRVWRGLEQLIASVADSAQALGVNVEATQGINQATVIVLSSNDAFDNERVLEVVAPLALQDTGPGGAIIIGFSFPFSVNGDYALNINLLADTQVTLPSGTVVTQEQCLGLTNALNDAAAATAGVQVGALYRNGSALMVRVA